MIRVLIADDHVIVRNGLRRLCGDMGDMTVVGEAKSGDEVLDAVLQTEIDLLLLDLSMPGLSGIRLIERIRAERCTVPILVLSMHSDLQVAKRALNAGATGFVAKGSTEDVLTTAIRKVAAKQRFIDSHIVEQMMFAESTGLETGGHESLSARELQVMTLFARGRTVMEIANDLCISHKTVSTHKSRAMEKLNIGSNAELIRYVADKGLIE